MEQPESEEVQKHQPDQGAPGDGRERAVHGVWEHGGQLRDRGALHQEPELRREEALRGVPRQCSGTARLDWLS